MSFLEKLLKGIALAVVTFSTVKKVLEEEDKDKNQNKDKEKNCFDDVIDI